MITSVLPSVDELHSDTLTNRTVVVIDAFRASSCIVTALLHGASWVRPAETVSEAREQSGDGILTGGERFSKPLEGFDLGNSPADYASPAIRNKGIVMTTTNGTRALMKASKASDILIGCFLNASACARVVQSLHRDVVFLCAGTRGHFSLEDGIAAGLILHRLSALDPSLGVDDLGRALLHSWLSCRSHLWETLSQSQSGQRLIGRGHKQDVMDCLQVDSCNAVPRWKEGYLTL
ncbi:2-phosphosulfolactate phosphatase [Salinithrix halophila]|uniref:Probable 2-phosphosulfolactate phosphatase n=1 Tax=Salinithrix halophila TaxID=1485204 RepID=A0ABV8JN88_9BACL